MGSFSVESIDFNAIRITDLETMAWLAQEIGRPDDARTWQRRADEVRTAFRSRMMYEQPYDLEGAQETPVRQESAAQFVTLFGGGPTPEQAERLVAQLQQAYHWPKFPVPTVPTNHADFVPDVYWRGNVWPSVNWLIYTGLRRYGYSDLAHQLAERNLALVEQNGFWEYYNPLTGQGCGAAEYSWAALVLDLLAWENKMSESLW